MASQWHIITCEYPNDHGGVSDYSFHLANSLAQNGSSVHVWCPGGSTESVKEHGIVVHRVLGKIGIQDIRRLGTMLDKFPSPRRLLVQWVPHGYGYRSMNLPFCFWVMSRASQKGDQVDLVVHEPFLPFRRWRWKQNFAAWIQRIMAIILLQAASRVWVSAFGWKKMLCPLSFRRNLKVQWLPVGSNIPVIDDPKGASGIHNQYAREGFLIGHFGTYEHLIKKELLGLLPKLGFIERASMIFFGNGSHEFLNEALERYPALKSTIYSLGTLTAAEVSRAIAACDLLIQPYSEGANARRTTLMAGLSHGIPIVSNIGPLTDPLLEQNSALVLVPSSDPDAILAAIQRLLQDPAERQRLATAGRNLYQEHFDWRHIVFALQSGSMAADVPAEDAAVNH